GVPVNNFSLYKSSVRVLMASSLSHGDATASGDLDYPWYHIIEDSLVNGVSLLLLVLCFFGRRIARQEAVRCVAV
uniref:hypothetical protein n=1 Tax=Salmonella sp. s39606 TaxID=3159643 RepID=UPI0039801C47